MVNVFQTVPPYCKILERTLEVRRELGYRVLQVSCPRGTDNWQLDMLDACTCSTTMSTYQRLHATISSSLQLVLCFAAQYRNSQ